MSEGAKENPDGLRSLFERIVALFAEYPEEPEVVAAAFCAALRYGYGPGAAKLMIKDMGTPDFHKHMERRAMAQVYKQGAPNKSAFARAVANYNKKMIKERLPMRLGTGTQDAKAMRKYLDRALKEFKS
jgi:hypothetical protein